MSINAQTLMKKERGRPRIYERVDTEPIKYYIKKGTRPSGRPKKKELLTLTAEQRKQHNRKLEYNYMLRRGKFIVKISYYEKTYKGIMPIDLINLPQNTDEEVILKFNAMYDFITEIKRAKLLNRIS